MKSAPCKHMRGRQCALGLFDGTPSAGTCLNHCDQYNGPERTPKLIAKITGITIKGGRVTMKQRKRKKPTLKQIRSWLHAELSLLTSGPVPLVVYHERFARCSKRAIDPKDGREYCTDCICGGKSRAKLDTKMHMPKFCCTTCGIEEADGEGRAALERLGGTVEQVRQQIKHAAGSLWELVFQSDQ